VVRPLLIRVCDASCSLDNVLRNPDHEKVSLTPPEKGLIMSHVSSELSQMTLLTFSLAQSLEPSASSCDTAIEQVICRDRIPRE
jgi:hypothetical protein